MSPITAGSVLDALNGQSSAADSSVKHGQTFLATLILFHSSLPRFTRPGMDFAPLSRAVKEHAETVIEMRFILTT